VAEETIGPEAIVGVRQRVISAIVPKWEREWRRYFRGLEERVIGALFGRKALANDEAFWAGEAATLKEILDRQYLEMTTTVWHDVVPGQLGTSTTFEPGFPQVQAIRQRIGQRVTMINESQRRQIEDLVASNLAERPNADVLERDMRKLLRSWGEPGGRAHIIALTESGFAYNYGALSGYGANGVTKVVVFDGPDCGWTHHKDPDLAARSTRTIQEAEAYPLSHPHCQRAFGPVPDLQAPLGGEVEVPEAAYFTSRTEWNEWEREAFRDWAKNIPDESIEAAESYASLGYLNINNYLRGFREELSELQQQAIREEIANLDKMFVPCPETIKVVRGTGWTSTFQKLRERLGDALDFENDPTAVEKLVGREFIEDGFMSTSLSEVVVAGSPKVQWHIVVPTGTPVAPLLQISQYSHERELLIKHGAKLLITHAAKLDTGRLYIEAVILGT
jgi:hypothetical protein